jgi:hypothetical protein
MARELWPYRSPVWAGDDLTEFSVQALDGSLGVVADGTYRLPTSYLLVDARSSSVGKKVVLPITVVDCVDDSGKTIYVHRTQDEIASAPEFDESRFQAAAARAELGRYYGPGGAGHRGPGPTKNGARATAASVNTTTGGTT